MDFLHKHSTANNSILKIIATFVFVSLPIFAFILGMNYQSQVDLANQIAATSMAVPQVVKNSKTPLAWKTYTNTKYGYSIDYPSDWTVREFPDSKTGASFYPPNKPVIIQSDAISINVNQKVFSDPSAGTFEEYAKVAGKNEVQGYGNSVTFGKITTASGLVGYKATWQMMGKDESGPFGYFEIPHNSKQILEFLGVKGENSDIYEQMLKTIHFLNK